MVPAPWAREAAAQYRGEDIGVHLTLNAEHELYRWGPVTHAPSLLDGEGGFPRRVDDLWEHADLDEVRRECRVQIERAILWGFDVTHLASHLGSMQLRPEFFDIYLELAIDFGLPIRLPSAETEASTGFPFRRLAAEEGVLFPDHFTPAHQAGSRERVERTLATLPSGVTEVHVQPMIDTPEVRALSPNWQAWARRLPARRARRGLGRCDRTVGCAPHRVPAAAGRAAGGMTVHRRIATIVVAVVAALALASCGDDADIPSTSDVDASVPVSSATVKITSAGFDPDSVSVPAGEAVTFSNDDDRDHRVVADDDSFDTGAIKPGESTVVLFNEAGTVKYSDTLDPSNTGQVEVTASTP